jgi:hypothetical protein
MLCPGLDIFLRIHNMLFLYGERLISTILPKKNASCRIILCRSFSNVFSFLQCASICVKLCLKNHDAKQHRTITSVGHRTLGFRHLREEPHSVLQPRYPALSSWTSIREQDASTRLVFSANPPRSSKPVRRREDTWCFLEAQSSAGVDGTHHLH